jgi:hypothetical protein
MEKERKLARAAQNKKFVWRQKQSIYNHTLTHANDRIMGARHSTDYLLYIRKIPVAISTQ